MMKTCIFCTSFIDEKGESTSLNRYSRWLAFYRDKLHEFGADHLFLIDDGSVDVNWGPEVGIIDPFRMPDILEKTINVVRFENNLGRPIWRDYRGWWRSFLFSVKIAGKYNFEKLIHIESDFYIVSSAMMNYMKSVQEGWITFYSKFYQFPESAIQIICRDRFSDLSRIYAEAEAKNFYMDLVSAELFLPFTTVEEGFYGDRFGEPEVLDEWMKHVEEPVRLDYIGQIHHTHKMDDYAGFFEFEYNF